MPPPSRIIRMATVLDYFFSFFFSLFFSLFFSSFYIITGKLQRVGFLRCTPILIFFLQPLDPLFGAWCPRDFLFFLFLLLFEEPLDPLFGAWCPWGVFLFFLCFIF